MSKYTEKWIAAGILVAALLFAVGLLIPALAFILALGAAVVFRERIIIAATLVAVGVWTLGLGYWTGRIFGILE